MERLALELCCSIGFLPTEYLGLPQERSIRPLVCAMGLKKDFVKGWLFEKDIISLKVGDSLSLEAHYPICLPI